MASISWAIVRTALSCSLLGIDPTWRCMKYARAPTASIRLQTNISQQILWENAQYIASRYPADQLANYQAAAQTFRIPYWDWAINPAMPDAVNQPMININTPEGLMNIVNPLYNYTFHPQPSAADFPPSDTVSSNIVTIWLPSSAIFPPSLACDTILIETS